MVSHYFHIKRLQVTKIISLFCYTFSLFGNWDEPYECEVGIVVIICTCLNRLKRGLERLSGHRAPVFARDYISYVKKWQQQQNEEVIYFPFWVAVLARQNDR
jgi:hypothetical protein